jgi:hypothetical protein
MRRRMNSFTTIAIVTPSCLSLASLPRTRAAHESASSACPQPELASAGARGRRSRGLNAVASTYTHCFRNPLASGWSVKSMPESAVAATAWSDTHPERCLPSTKWSEKKWRSKATDGAMPAKASHKKANPERRMMDPGSRCSAWIW